MKPIPTIASIYSDLESDLKGRLNLTDTDLKEVVNAIAIVLSAQLKLQYLYLSDVANNLFPDTADLAVDGGELNRMGQIYLNRQPRPATDGKYIIALTGAIGSVVRSGLTFKSNENSKSPGSLFIMDFEYILNGVDDFVEIRSLESGINHSLEINNELTITEPVIGVEQTVSVFSIVQLPVEEETTKHYRRSIINTRQLEPQGGAKTDYRLWSDDAAGVQNIYPYVKAGEAGTVQIFVEATKVDSTDGKGTPSIPLLLNVEEVIKFDPDITLPTNERGRKPIQVNLEVLPILLKPVDVTIYGLEIDSIEIRNTIKESLDIYLEGVRPFIDGADLARNKNDILYLARLQSVVTDVIGNLNFFTDFKMEVEGVDENIFVFDGANIPYLRNLNYV